MKRREAHAHAPLFHACRQYRLTVALNREEDPMAFNKEHRHRAMTSSSVRSAAQVPCLLQTCYACRFVRADMQAGNQDQWMPPEVFFRRHPVTSTPLVFTHTFCPDCLKEIQDRMGQDRRGQTEK